MTSYAYAFDSSLASPMDDTFGAVTRNVAHYLRDAVTETVQSVQTLMPLVFGSSVTTFVASHAATFAVTTNLSLGVERATRADLVAFASNRLHEIKKLGSADVTPEAETSFWRVLSDFVRDDGPTPQLAPTGDGTIELQWLAGGVFVSAIFDESGSFEMFALKDDVEVLLDFETEFGQSIDSTLFSQLEEIFSDMGKSAKTRPAYWI